MGNEQNTHSQDEINNRYETLHKDAEAGGYHLNPDVEFTKELVDGLLTNEQRYGYEACPCRLASGDTQDDLDIICPCDYRDQDLNEYDSCYCGLYVSGRVVRGEKAIGSIPERRPPEDSRHQVRQGSADAKPGQLPYPVWRCKVCGYLCAREQPPENCPVCKAKKERFERFLS